MNNDEIIDNQQSKKIKRETIVKKNMEKLPTITSDIYDNPYLEILEIKRNGTFLTIPNEIVRLNPNLIQLSFENTKLNNPLLIFNLKNLQKLDLTSTNLSNLPSEIANLTQLRHLILSGNLLSSLPPEFSQLKMLNDLSLEFNKFTSVPDVICELKNLITLSMAYNKIITIPNNLSNLKSLVKLSFSNNYINDMHNINNLPNLEHLYLYANKIEYIPPTIETLPNLKNLIISNNKIHELPDSFGKLYNLFSLSAESNAIVKITPELKNLTRLKELILNDNLIDSVEVLDVIQTLNFDNISIEINDNPINSSYIVLNDPQMNDPVFNIFNKMMNTFSYNPNTIINKNNGYINDSILYNQRNPYVVHYENYNGKDYPILTILKGTLLFTAREHISNSLSTSFFHLYKLYGNPTLTNYEKNDFEDVMTYFFPVPYIASIVNLDFTTMDMVVLTKEVRLMCLISPSPITRGDKSEKENLVDINNNPYYEDEIKPCPTRDYDACISREIIYGLRLNGYIGLAYQDSLSHPDNEDLIKEIINGMDFKKTALYRCSTFNNTIHKLSDAKGDTFLERMLSCRTFGIPEIVLIPYDIHSYTDHVDYEYVYKDYEQLSNNSSNDIDTSKFIFKYILHVNGNDSFEIADLILKEIKNLVVSSKIMKSLQAYPLFNVLKSQVDLNNIFVREMLKEINDPVDANSLAFVNSYVTPSTSHSAIEMLSFYDYVEKNFKNYNIGGYSINENTATQNNILMPQIEKNISLKPELKIESELKEESYPIKKIKSDKIFYGEIDSIPIIAFKRKVKKGGKKMKKIKKTKKHKKIAKRTYKRKKLNTKSKLRRTVKRHIKKRKTRK